MKKDIIQPKKVQRINCPNCGELQVKIYPWSSYQIQTNVGMIEGMMINNCIKCQNKVR